MYVYNVSHIFFPLRPLIEKSFLSSAIHQRECVDTRISILETQFTVSQACDTEEKLQFLLSPRTNARDLSKLMCPFNGSENSIYRRPLEISKVLSIRQVFLARGKWTATYFVFHQREPMVILQTTAIIIIVYTGCYFKKKSLQS